VDRADHRLPSAAAAAAASSSSFSSSDAALRKAAACLGPSDANGGVTPGANVASASRPPHPAAAVGSSAAI